MYNIQTFYGWQTQYKCVMSTHKIFYEYTQMYPHSTTKYTANTPLIIYVCPRNTQRTSVKRRGPIHRARIFLLPFHILLQTKSEKSKAGNPKNNK